jgi:ankyrin repeat protein
MVRVLVEFGASLAALADEDGSVLHHAIAGRDLPSFAAVLLDLQVPVNQADRNGWTPLHLAAAHGYEGSVQLLLDHGADVTARTLHGLTPADFAANNGHRRLALALSAPTPPDHAR